MEGCLDFNLSVMGATGGFYEGEWQELASAFMRWPWLPCVPTVSRKKAVRLC